MGLDQVSGDLDTRSVGLVERSGYIDPTVDDAQQTQTVSNTSSRAAYRRFTTETSVQIQIIERITLTQQFQSGELQKKVAAREINPHTLIHQAILENEPQVIRFLLNQGVDVDYPDKDGMSPLTIAILNGCHFAVKILMEYGANPNPTAQWNGMSLLELAMSMNDVDSAMLLIQGGFDVNYIINLGPKQHQKENILINVFNRVPRNRMFVNVAKEMIIRGADIYSNEGRNCALAYAISFAQNGEYSLLNLCIEKGVNLNMVMINRGMEYNTPLLQAIGSGNLSLVQFLVESGADIHKTINYAGRQRSPLNYALELGRSEIAQYLLRNGARK